MDGARNQLLAGSGLTADENGGIALRHLAHHCQHFLERAARADDALEVVDVALRVTEVIDLMLHPPHLERLLDLDLHLLDLEGLLHVVERARLDGLDGGGYGAERGHEDDGGRGMQLLRGLQDLEPGAATHLQVADDDVEEALVELLDGGVAIRRFLDLVPRFGNRLRESAAERVVVVCDQYAAHFVLFYFALYFSSLFGIPAQRNR